tara:strand:+ start:3983 stop:4978 length:996 start_codon:yes stop_codon:yes gene_type:complete
LILKNKYKIIAEIGSVHDGKLSLAKKLIEKAAKSGADVVKFQMHIADEETLKNAPSPNYFKTEPRYSYFKRTAFNFEEWKKIIKFCKSNKVEFLCSPFSEKAVDILESLKVSSYKLPSGELTNHPLIEKLKKTKKHIFVSTGMSNWKEIDLAVNILKKNFTLMQCSSIYPCPNNKVGINILSEIKSKYKCNIGFSDHTLGFSAAFASAAAGATIIEKHFTISKKMYGSDAKHSMEPNDFKFLAKTIKDIWYIMMHPVNKNKINQYKSMRNIFQKSIVTKRYLRKGINLKISDIDFKKPGNGIKALSYKNVLGKKIKKNLKKNILLKYSDLK